MHKRQDMLTEAIYEACKEPGKITAEVARDLALQTYGGDDGDESRLADVEFLDAASGQLLGLIHDVRSGFWFILWPSRLFADGREMIASHKGKGFEEADDAMWHAFVGIGESTPTLTEQAQQGGVAAYWGVSNAAVDRIILEAVLRREAANRGKEEPHVTGRPRRGAL